ncbi:MAG: GAF domain-containing protein [Ardenticatenaceae bacterium]|nr:GAF domain-containing protein [Anaerolineales bacterium]MCB8921876.1 GAF domain-containing protein [Ardenticatenaceae bacterium]
MNSITHLFTEHLDVVFFLYGLAFFSMGLAVMLESGRSSEFRLARAMGSLAAFGILHGIHEWLEMFQRWGKFDNLTPEQLFFLNGIRMGALVLSFLFLVIFGIRLIFSNRGTVKNEYSLAMIAAGSLAAFWLGSVVLTRLVYQPSPTELVKAADVLARYIAGIPGAILAAWAIVLEQRAFKARGMPDFGRALWWAAIAILLYGVVGQFFTTPSFLFPANVINADVFQKWFDFPVQLFRAVMAAIMALFVIRALRAFELESQQRLAMANEARLSAQQEALETQRQARRETEQLNQALQTAVQDLTVLFGLSRSLSATLSREQLLQNVVLQIFDNLPRIDGGLILLRERAEEPGKIVTMSGFEGRITPEDPDNCGLNRAYKLGDFVLSTGQIAICDTQNIIPLGNTDDLILDQYDNTPITNAQTVGVPLIIQEELMGSLVLSAWTTKSPFTVRDLYLISTVAGQLGIALTNAHLYEEVQAREALRGELLHQVVTAQENERQRIARELHDGTGQTLTALGLGLAAAMESARQKANNNLDNQLHDLRVISAQALQEVHDVIADLRPSLLDNLGLISALRSQVHDLEKRTHIRATLVVSGERRRLRSALETVVFRIAQEALTNVTKHARAQSVTVNLHFEPHLLALRVTDDGRGFAPEDALHNRKKNRQAWGLLGMQERAALVGGSCNIMAQPGMGTTIEVTVPLQGEEMTYAEDQVNAG